MIYVINNIIVYNQKGKLQKNPKEELILLHMPLVKKIANNMYKKINFLMDLNEAVDLVLRNIRLGATIDGLVRKEKYELPPEAIREILFLVCIRLSVVEMGLKSNTWIL